VELYLDLAKKYLPDDRFIGAVGRSEAINIAEFRATQPLQYAISVEEQTGLVDSQLGRMLTFNQLLQYAGSNLTRDDIGRIMKQMPFMNNKEVFSDMTINYENVTNDMLALERGETVDIGPYADNEYYVEKLENRIKQPDFRFLDPQIQQNYQNLLMMHEQEVARKQQQIIDAKNEYIPIGGAMIKADMYVPDPNRPDRTKRVEIPYQALDWLISQLAKQGMSLDKLDGMSKSVAADISQQMLLEQAMQGSGGQSAPNGQVGPDVGYGMPSLIKG
jgi:hypothetical protein